MNQATEKDNRDQHVGRSIAAAVQQQGKLRACLSDEQLATLLDNQMLAGERERCLAHIAACDSCLAHYSAAASLLQDSVGATKAAGRGLLYTGIAIAAVAVLVIGLVLQQPPGKNSGQLQVAGQGSIGTMAVTMSETDRLQQKLKVWSEETLDAIETKQFDKIDKITPVTLQQEAQKMGDMSLVARLNPLIRHLAEPGGSEEWSAGLVSLIKEL